MSLQGNLGIERIAVKMSCAGDLLKKITETAACIEASEKKVLRYVRQAKLLLVLRRGNAAMRIVGSTAKTVGAVTVIASSFNPKLRMAIGAGERLWKFGAGLKILSNIAGALKELWQKGCRNCLVEFTKNTAQLVKNLGVFSELVEDLKQVVNTIDSGQNLNSPGHFWNALSSFFPDSQRIYIGHIIYIVFGSQSYSPLFDFAALVTDPSNDSSVLQLMREIESLQFLNFVQESDSKPLIAVGSFLHVTRELLDFLDGLQSLTDSDCVFLQQCLYKFTEECVKINSVVLFLKSLNDLRGEFASISQLDLVSQNQSTMLMPPIVENNVEQSISTARSVCHISSSGGQNEQMQE